MGRLQNSGIRITMDQFQQSRPPSVLSPPQIEQRARKLPTHQALLIRGLDAAVAGFLLLAFAVPMACLALLVKLTSPGPAIYVQERVGQMGKTFRMYKFRSMSVDAEACTGPVWASKADPRQTWLGRIMRRYCIDELPQLFNVLRGDMSLVGPRPERPHFVDRFNRQYSNYSLRHSVRPGMTGWAQINGWYGNSDLGHRLENDLYYVEHQSFLFNLWVLAMTPWRVTRGHNEEVPQSFSTTAADSGRTTLAAVSQQSNEAAHTLRVVEPDDVDGNVAPGNQDLEDRSHRPGRSDIHPDRKAA